jgi:proton-translocating NADH-quinone oxidoreductase chain N
MTLPVWAWIIVLPLITSPLVYFIGHLGKSRGVFAQRTALLALAATWVAFVLAAQDLQLNGISKLMVGSVSLKFDGLSLLLAMIALVLGSFVVIFSGHYLANEEGQEKYYAMLVAMIGVMIGLGCTNDLFNLWIWFEAMAVTSYLLVAFYKDLPTSLEAGIKYLVQSAAGSILVLLAIGLVVAETGALNLDEIRQTAESSPALMAAGILFVIGYGVKTALVPLHTWLPDAHSQAPSGISAMLSGIVIEAGLIAMLRSLSALSGVTTFWGPLLMGFGILNMVVGNLMAFGQAQVKRMLAYSSLVHVGYMLIGLGIAFSMRDVIGAQGGFFHMFTHGLMKGLAFLAAGSMLYTLHISKGDHRPLLFEDLAGAAKRYPWAALTLSIALFSLAGLPPLAGFMSKWQIFVAGVDTHNGWIIAVVAFAALNSVFSLTYYAPLVNNVYRCEPSAIVLSGKRLPVVMKLPLVLMALGIIAIGIWPSLMNWLTEPAGTALLASLGG